MMELDDLEVFYLRKWLSEEVKKNCNGWEPESKDYEALKTKALSQIAYKIWEKNNKPQNDDMSIWFQAEGIWNFIRYAWI